MKRKREYWLIFVSGMTVLILFGIWYYQPKRNLKVNTEMDMVMNVSMWGEDRELTKEQQEQILNWIEGLSFQRRIFFPHSRGREGIYRIDVRINTVQSSGSRQDWEFTLWANTPDECTVLIDSGLMDTSRYVILNGKEAAETLIHILDEDELYKMK